jgi:hypothetical protein
MAAFALPIIQGLGGLFGGIFGGSSQASAARQAAGVEAGTMGRNAEQLAEVGGQQLKPELAAQAPYAQLGQQSASTLGQLLKTPGQGLLAPYQSFQAPTGVNYQNDPGYQFRLQQGVQALQNSAAARGDLLSGNTLQALTQLGQGLGSEEYGNVYNRALQGYQTNAQNYYTGQGNEYSRLMGGVGVGQNAAQMAQQARQFYQGIYGNAMNMSNESSMANAAGILGSNAANVGGWTSGLGAGLSSLGQLLNMPGSQPTTSGYGTNASPFGLMQPPSGAAAYGLGSLSGGGGWGIGGYGQGYPQFNQSGY